MKTKIKEIKKKHERTRIKDVKHWWMRYDGNC